MRERAKDIEAIEAERNLYKGKYRAFLKLIKKTRNKLVQVTDHIEDEGDRRYFGSTNDADDLRELYHEMMSWIWDSVDETNRMKSDPYADIRKQRARAEKAEAEISAQQERIKALEEAALHIAPYLIFTIGEESPGWHPTMPSAVDAFLTVFGLETEEKRRDAIRAALHPTA